MGLALLLLPLGAWALDLSPDASRVLSDPTYLPLGGQFFGSTEYSYNQVNSNTDNYQGKMTASTSVKTTTLTQVLDFGLTDDLTLRASGFYQLNGTNSQDPSGVSTLTSSYGMSDPTIALVCRVLDEKGAPFNWDLKASYTPDLINAESASADLSGSVARGGSTAAFGTALSYKGKDFTLYLVGDGTYLDEKDVLNQNNGITTSYQPSWVYSLDATTQTRFAEGLSLNAGVSMTFNQSVNASYVNAANKVIDFTNQPSDITYLILALNYQVTPGKLAASLLYSHDFYGQSGNTYLSKPQLDNTIVDRYNDLVGAELRYVFN